MVEPRQRWKEIRSHCSCHRFHIIISCFSVGYARAYDTRSPTANILRRFAAYLSAAWLRRESNGLLPGRIPRRRRIARASPCSVLRAQLEGMARAQHEVHP